MRKNNKKDDKPELVELGKRFLRKKYQDLLVKLAKEVLESPTCSPFQKRKWNW